MNDVIKKSAGCFVISKLEGKYYVLLQEKLWENGITGWVPPKGGIELYEEESKAALRETQEETGIRNIKILEKLASEEFNFQENNANIHKTVVWFLAIAKDQKLGEKKLTEHEKSTQKTVKWVEINIAIDKMLFESEKEILKKIIKKLNNEELLYI